MATKTDVQNAIRTEINDSIIEALEKGVKPWRRPWMGDGLARNIVSKKPYRGINPILLMIHQMRYGLTANVFGTFNQWKGKECPVKKGAKGARIVFFQQVSYVKHEGTEDEKRGSFPLLKTFVVFSADQTEGGEKFCQPPEKRDIPPHDVAEALIKATGAKVNVGGDRAYYSPSADAITMPEREKFESVESYYGTYLHELTHWTGHESRLDRLEKFTRFGSQSYAMEELVAEIGGCYLLGACNLPVLDALHNHASYLDNWLQCLRADPKAIFQATGAASAGADFCLRMGGMLEEEAKEEPATV